MSFLFIGIMGILLGMRAFSAQGLSVTRKTRLKGSWGKAIGVACILLGVASLVAGTYMTMQETQTEGRMH